MNQFIERVKNVDDIQSRFRSPKEDIELQPYFLPHYFATADIYKEEDLMKKSAQSIYDPKKFLLQATKEDLKPKSSRKSLTK